MKPVILGAGLAGLTTALALSPLPVILVSPTVLGKGCSSDLAQGGIAAALAADDRTTFHADDTITVGNSMNDISVVTQVTQDAPLLVEKLVALGVPFNRDDKGQLLLGLEAAHHKRRIVHADDATGHAIMDVLIAHVRKIPSIEILENTIAQKLMTDGEKITAVVLRSGDTEKTIPTNAVVLATGGAAALWSHTTNPHENWGSGLALAARAGATLGDLEFMQFHPTAIDAGRDPMPLASETIRGEGAILINETGARFIDELKPRDIVARALWEQVSKGHRVFLDTKRAIGDRFPLLFPTIHAMCLSLGIDPILSTIPVRPASHYHMGGVLTDMRGRTDVPGLWACGEAACTGLHGANRLASNSLLEALSFGQRVANDIKGSKMGTSGTSLETKSISKTQGPQLQNTIRNLMSEHVGVIRDAKGLQYALDTLSPLIEKSDMALVGYMVADSALKREESRGAHFRRDFPQTNSVAHRSRFRLTDRKDA